MPNSVTIRAAVKYGILAPVGVGLSAAYSIDTNVEPVTLEHRAARLSGTAIIALPCYKDPDDVMPYRMSYALFIRWEDTVIESTWVCEGLTLSKPHIDADGLGTTVWIAGGIAGQTYTVTNTVTTARLRTLTRSFGVHVEDR